MTDRIRVAVLRGGPDDEREVSLASGSRVCAALGRDPRFDLIDCVVDRPSTKELAGLGAQVIFPVLHGPFGEGGPLQERLEATGIPYVGSGPAASALAMDKCATKTACAEVGVPTPRWAELQPGSACPFAPPLVLKPVDDGSSVGVRICHDAEEVATARRELEPTHARLMAELHVSGRELTIGVVFGTLLPTIEIRPAVEFYDYDAKYERDDTAYLFDPELDPGVEDDCRRFAEATWKRLGCRDLARIDFMLDENGPWFLEVNTMPGFTDHSLVPMAARRIGIEMPELCGRLVMCALERHPERSAAHDAMAGT